MKKLMFLLFFVLPGQAWAWAYSYIPKTSSPTIYNFLYQKREKCAVGEKKEYPKKIGVCAACPESTVYMIDEAQSKALCFKCPEGTLLVKRNDYPMCLSMYPVINGKAQKPNGDSIDPEELERMALRLSADYKTNLPARPKEAEKTFNNKEKLTNVCPSSYPEDDTAQKQIDICRRLVSQNDFLCPYVEKNAEGKWTCRACPKNAPYKNKQGGCFNCPYGEEMIALESGTLVCASEAPPQPKKKAPAAKKAPAKAAVKKAAKKAPAKAAATKKTAVPTKKK
ncbi:MAG: hypothetical protein IJ752_05950 [Alphaproteobacteria bacterium]|nr:hypothetical protein [Alphaproteobacteria bacterium]